MAKLCALFSGSKANCTYVAANDGALLVDAGASAKATLNAIAEIGESCEKVKAILITHEHNDHIKGLKTLVKTLKVPVIASSLTLESLIKMNALPENAVTVAVDSGVYDSSVGRIIRFETMHDCQGSSGYRIEFDGERIASVCTDLGVVTSEVRGSLKGSNLVLLESNHDLKMLQNGPYPPELKIRIAGERGHLSNSAAASELVSLLHSGTASFVLGHLSENNNLPALALRTSEAALIDAGAQNGRDYRLFCAGKENRNIIYF